MRSMFHTRRHNVPSLNVASMPDLIFTVLFFFMIVTHMRNDEVQVRLQVPEGNEVRKLANKSSVVNIYIGRQVNKETGRQGEDWLVQLNGDLVKPEELPARIEQIRATMSPELAERLTVSLRADRHTPMGIIQDVKQALQQSYALRINYSATEIQ
ncbi:ExbD/TolR family protein [Prevotella sp. ne3005]|uniref:ExbD/TolR family protein n=1 Tax=Prevotella sp. ne3005 TaxID=1761887 RepID=UPI000B884920|nr:biopolymer transporter ExbD [Prevotella sp. ne3005]